MLNQIKRLLAPPVFEGDEDKTRLARILNTILWFSLLIWLSSSISLFFSPQILLGALTIGSLLLLGSGALLLMNRGYVRLVAWLFSLVLWLAVTILVAISGGIINPETTGYVVVVMTAGLLSGAQTALVFAGLSVISACGVFFFEQQGWVDTNILTVGPSGGLTIVIVNISMVTALLYLALTSLNHALRRARRNEQSLLENNRELQTIRASLEEQVVERTQGLAAAKEAAEAANRQLETQMWQITGQAQLSQVMQGEQDLNTLAHNVVGHLCQYLEAQVGLLFLAQDAVLELKGGYAYTPDQSAVKRFKLGEGLVGQAALEKQPISLTNLSEEHLILASGLGEVIPQQVLVYPFVYAGQVVGVLELGKLTEFGPEQATFLDKALESVAVAFHTAQTRGRVDELLLETQQQAEEMQVREEELRAANEELAAQTEQLRAIQAR